mgnify:CR=1 FL=1
MGDSMEEVECVVVGGGPVGLCLAIGLAQRGVQVVVLEERLSKEKKRRIETEYAVPLHSGAL